jgi:hypothetical protein
MCIITPIGPWCIAEFADVDCPHLGKHFFNVPINRITQTPATLIIRKDEYPNGKIIFNEELAPCDPNPIDTQHQGNIQVILVPPNQDEVLVDIPMNVGWPSGVIVLWDE